MNKKAKQAPRALVCLLLAVLLLTSGFPARVAAGTLGSVTPDKTESAHGGRLWISCSFPFFINTDEGTFTAELSHYWNGIYIGGMSFSDENIRYYNQTIPFSGGYGFTVPDTNVSSHSFTWTFNLDINGVKSSDSGSFVITVLHSYGTWAHDTATGGTGSRHTSACSVCGREESQPCSFSGSVAASQTCTQEGETDFTCGVCGYSYMRVTPALGHDYASALTEATCTQPGYTTFTCRRCGDTYTDGNTPALGHDYASALTEATCTQPGYTTFTCGRCGDTYIGGKTPALGHKPGLWTVIEPASNKKAGVETLSCLRCGELLDTLKIPILSETWPDNTACSYGPRFRDEAPALTDKWYTYTPVDLTQDGDTEVPLIASNRYRIGTVKITVKDGQVWANYQITADKVQLKEEFMTFMPGLEGVETLEPQALAGKGVPFGAPVDAAGLGENGRALFFMRLVLTYDIYADGVKWWSMP